MVTQVTSEVIADNAITGTKIAAGSITGTAIANNTIDGTKIALGSDAQGDIMYYDGTNWVRLPAGTSGRFLKTNGTNANPSWSATAWGGTEDPGATGSITFPGGIVLQWGRVNTVTAGTTVTVTYPIAHASGIYNVTISPIGPIDTTSAGSTSIQTITTTSFNINNGTGVTRDFMWHSIGK